MSLRTLLRESTAASHNAIEKNPRLSLLTSSSLDESSYVEILKKYYGFFRPIENALRASDVASSVVPSLHERFKSGELTEDLLAFGLTAQEIEALPFASSLPPVSSRAEILGAMYVMEGSALGGMMIARHLAKLPFYRAGRDSFFHANGAAVSARWKSYLAALENVPEPEWPAVAASATAMFAALDGWMAD